MYFGFENVSIAYAHEPILEDVTISFSKGKISTLIGANGSGKTSLLRTISNAVIPTQGRVVFEGKSLSAYTPKCLAQKIAYLPQEHSAPPDIDVQTLVSYGRYPYKRFGKGLSSADRRIVDETIERAGLGALKKRTVSTLSGGERQRAWIAMAICQQPEILVLDEPITHLDIGFQLEVMHLIQRLGLEMPITIVMVLHDINLAARYSDYLYCITGQSVYAQGIPETMITPEHLKTVFNIDAQIFEDPKNACPFIIPEKHVDTLT